jgi:large subunit ribosomal protein LP0
MSGGAGSDRKQAYFAKLIQLLDEYPKILIVGADNVGSFHMQTIRKSLRGKAILLMGKNTMIRKAIRGHITKNPNLEKILGHVKGNIGFVFTKDDLGEIAKLLTENKVEAVAKAGGIAPSDVIVPAGSTNLEPTKTSFFQALNIATKIARGQIDISVDVHLIKAGEKVNNSQAALLQMLNMKPFKYGLQLITIYEDGSIYDPSILKITTDDILASFRKGIATLTAVSLGSGYPTAPAMPHLVSHGFKKAVKNVASISLATGNYSTAALPHYVANGFKKVLSIALATDFPIPQTKRLSAPVAVAAPVAEKKGKEEAPKKGKEEAKKEKEPEPEPAEEEDMGLGLFD